VLLLLLIIALRIAGSTSARFVVFACWLRFMLSSFHVYTLREVLGGLSGNAIGSTALFMLGVALLPPRLLFNPKLLALYGVIAIIFVSALMNGVLFDAVEPVTKLMLLLVLALHTYRALQGGGERRFGLALLLSFTPLLLFQALSVLLDVPKSTEGSGGESYIGGYYHEAAFSVGLVALLVSTAVSRRVPASLKAVIVAIVLVSILLANYRTAILASAPLLIYYLLYGLSRVFDRRLRAPLVAMTAVAMIASGGIAVMTVDRFTDLQSVVEQGPDLIKPPDEFTTADRQLLSSRALIWSQYIYQWKDGNELQQLIGYGPDSWEQYFSLYAHNTFISYLFEYGVLGLSILIWLFLSGLVLAARAHQFRWALLAAHLSFLILNLATMPLWAVEGAILYGVLLGFTLSYREQGSLVALRTAGSATISSPRSVPSPDEGTPSQRHFLASVHGIQSDAKT
jgi:hypothetical protein